MNRPVKNVVYKLKNLSSKETKGIIYRKPLFTKTNL